MDKHPDRIIIEQGDLGYAPGIGQLPKEDLRIAPITEEALMSEREDDTFEISEAIRVLNSLPKKELGKYRVCRYVGTSKTGILEGVLNKDGFPYITCRANCKNRAMFTEFSRYDLDGITICRTNGLIPLNLWERASTAIVERITYVSNLVFVSLAFRREYRERADASFDEGDLETFEKNRKKKEDKK
jgi:hypothetical protein